MRWNSLSHPPISNPYTMLAILYFHMHFGYGTWLFPSMSNQSRQVSLIRTFLMVSPTSWWINVPVLQSKLLATFAQKVPASGDYSGDHYNCPAAYLFQDPCPVQWWQRHILCLIGNWDTPRCYCPWFRSYTSPSPADERSCSPCLLGLSTETPRNRWSVVPGLYFPAAYKVSTARFFRRIYYPSYSRRSLLIINYTPCKLRQWYCSTFLMPFGTILCSVCGFATHISSLKSAITGIRAILALVLGALCRVYFVFCFVQPTSDVITTPFNLMDYSCSYYSERKSLFAL